APSPARLPGGDRDLRDRRLRVFGDGDRLDRGPTRRVGTVHPADGSVHGPDQGLAVAGPDREPAVRHVPDLELHRPGIDAARAPDRLAGGVFLDPPVPRGSRVQLLRAHSDHGRSAHDRIFDPARGGEHHRRLSARFHHQAGGGVRDLVPAPAGGGDLDAGRSGHPEVPLEQVAPCRGHHLDPRGGGDSGRWTVAAHPGGADRGALLPLDLALDVSGARFGEAAEAARGGRGGARRWERSSASADGGRRWPTSGAGFGFDSGAHSARRCRLGDCARARQRLAGRARRRLILRPGERRARGRRTDGASTRPDSSGRTDASVRRSHPTEDRSVPVRGGRGSEMKAKSSASRGDRSAAPRTGQRRTSGSAPARPARRASKGGAKKKKDEAVLTIDIGNSHASIGVFEGESLAAQFRLSSGVTRTGDELIPMLSHLLGSHRDALSRSKRAVIASVVPSLTEAYFDVVWKILGIRPILVGAGMLRGLRLDVPDPDSVGADRLANAVAAAELHGSPSVTVDLGTTTNFDVVLPGPRYVGGAIAPGLVSSAEELFRRGARLPKVEIRRPERALGRT